MQDKKPDQDKPISLRDRVKQIESNPPNERCRLLLKAAKRTRPK